MALQQSSLINNGTSTITSDPRSTIEVTFQALTMCLIMLSSLVGNSLIIIAIYIDRTLQNVTNVFVVNLACADLLLALSGMPFTLVSSITYDWIFGPVWCDIHGMANSLFCVASMLTLAAVSIDRFIAILRPLRYTSYMTSKTAAAMIVYIWVHSLLVALLPVMGWSEYSFLKKESICTIYWELDISLTIFIFVVCFFFPFAIMIFTYSRVLNAAWKQSKRIVPITGRFSEKKKPERNESTTLGEPISIGSAESVYQQSQTISTGLPTPLSTDETINDLNTQMRKLCILGREIHLMKTDRIDNVNRNASKMQVCLANKIELPEHIDNALKCTQDFTSTIKIDKKENGYTRNGSIISENFKSLHNSDDSTMKFNASSENGQQMMSIVLEKNNPIVQQNSIIINEPWLQDNHIVNQTRNGRRVVICNDSKPEYDTFSQSSLEVLDDITSNEETVFTETEIQKIEIKPSSLYDQKYQRFEPLGDKPHTDITGNTYIKPLTLYNQESGGNKMLVNEKTTSNVVLENYEQWLCSQKPETLGTAAHNKRISTYKGQEVSVEPSKLCRLELMNSETGATFFGHNIDNKNTNKYNINDRNNRNKKNSYSNTTSSSNNNDDSYSKEINNLDADSSARTPQFIIDAVQTPSHTPQDTPRMRRITVSGCVPTIDNYGIQNGIIKHQSSYNSTPNLKKKNSLTSLRVDAGNNSNTRQRKVSAFRIPSPNIKALRKKSINTNGLLKLKKEKKAVRTLLIVVGTFVLCWLPHFIGIFCILTKECTWPDRYFAITTWLAMSNSGCNPVIYGAMSRQFRKRFKQILQCKRDFF